MIYGSIQPAVVGNNKRVNVDSNTTKTLFWYWNGITLLLVMVANKSNPTTQISKNCVHLNNKLNMHGEFNIKWDWNKYLIRATSWRRYFVPQRFKLIKVLGLRYSCFFGTKAHLVKDVQVKKGCKKFFEKKYCL